ncbi:SIR2 family protein [Clostridium butyricum]|nr:SIR2 family protein [Clostridium butyricum]
MQETVLSYLEKNNQFPIIFIGAGISKRYLKNYPSWLELLEEIWLKVHIDGDFYGHLLQMKECLSSSSSFCNDDKEKKLDQLININIASEIEKDLNSAFNNGKIKISNLTTKDVFTNNLSPFKKYIADRFSKYELKEGLEDEYTQFKNMLKKSQVIMTTNYDSFIENSYNENNSNTISIFNGESGLFRPFTGYSELYKLHGSYDDINSIVITKEDYDRFDKSSVLISSKIITLLLNSPIIFLGYSLNDVNIRKIIKNFVSSLSQNEKNILEKNLIFVNWKSGENNIIERIENSSELGCRYRVIETDNYKKIYESISKIEQGLTPIEVNKYIRSIKKIIVNEGSKGNLDKVLVDRGDLDSILNEDIKDKKLVVAIGDKQYIFVIPTLATYCRDYILEKYNGDIENILRFILTHQGQLPLKKYLTEDNINNSSLTDKEKEKLNNRLKKYNDKTIAKLITECKSKNHTINCFNSFNDILELECKPYYQYRTIICNFNNLDISEIKQFLLYKINEYIVNNEDLDDSDLRKLIVLYDLKVNS